MAVCPCCRLTTELLHEAHIPMGVEGQSVWCYTQGVEEVGGSDALQRLNALCTHCPHLLLRQTAVAQWKDVCQGHILLQTHKHTLSKFSQNSPCCQLTAWANSRGTDLLKCKCRECKVKVWFQDSHLITLCSTEGCWRVMSSTWSL